MNLSERSLLLETADNNLRFRQQYNISRHHAGLSVFFSIICIVDVFGVFPVITLPKAVIDCGFYGVIVVITVCSIQMYTAILLGKCWVIAADLDPIIYRKNRYPYSALAELTYGTTLSNFVTFLLDITVFGGGIPNLIVASQNLQLLGLRLSEKSFDLSFCYWIIIMGAILCPILWLGSPKDMKLLCSISVVIVATVFLLINGCLVFSTSTTTTTGAAEAKTQHFDKNNTPLPLWQVIFILYGIIAFQFDIHPSILTIQVDMNEKSKLNRAVLAGFAVSLGMFSITSITAVIKMGTNLQPSILQSLPASIALHFAAALIALQLCLSSGVSNSALYQHMEDCMGISRNFNQRRCILRTTITLLAILIAESVPRFDLVMSLIGGTLTGPLVFILPPLFYMRISYLQNQRQKQLAMESFSNIVYNNPEDKRKSWSKFITKQFQEEFDEGNSICVYEGVSLFDGICRKIEILFCILIIFFSICFTIATTYINVINAWDFAVFSQPCIYNVSSALINL